MIYAIGLESHYFNGQRMVRSKPDSGLRKIADETGGGYFELKKTSRPRADLHARRAGTAQPVRARLHADGCSTARCTSWRSKMKQPGMTARARRSYLADWRQESGRAGAYDEQRARRCVTRTQ